MPDPLADLVAQLRKDAGALCARKGGPSPVAERIMDAADRLEGAAKFARVFGDWELVAALKLDGDLEGNAREH